MYRISLYLVQDCKCFSYCLSLRCSRFVVQ